LANIDVLDQSIAVISFYRSIRQIIETKLQVESHTTLVNHSRKNFCIRDNLNIDVVTRKASVCVTQPLRRQIKSRKREEKGCTISKPKLDDKKGKI